MRRKKTERSEGIPSVKEMRFMIDNIKIKQVPVKSVTIFCTACTQKFIARKKDDKGILIRQQFCPHTTLEGVEI